MVWSEILQFTQLVAIKALKLEWGPPTTCLTGVACGCHVWTTTEAPMHAMSLVLIFLKYQAST
jgi:hypothetical protein